MYSAEGKLDEYQDCRREKLKQAIPSQNPVSQQMDLNSKWISRTSQKISFPDNDIYVDFEVERLDRSSIASNVAEWTFFDTMKEVSQLRNYES